VSMDGAVTEPSVVVLLLSSEYSGRRSETLPASSCVSGVEDIADNVHVKIGDDVITSAAVISGAIVVVRVGNTGGTGATSLETGNVAFSVELLCVARVEYAYLKVYVVLMVDGIGPFRWLLELYLGCPMIEKRLVVVARIAEGICVFKEQTLDRGALAFEAFLAFDVLGCMLQEATLGLVTLRTTRVQPSEAGEFLEVVCTMFGVSLGDVSCI
jgi:hypothetical protein